MSVVGRRQPNERPLYSEWSAGPPGPLTILQESLSMHKSIASSIHSESYEVVILF